MPTFGRFETVDELASRGPYAVWSARSAGDAGPPKLAIKSFETLDPLADEQLTESRAKAFLDAAEAQRALAGAPGWAGVHDVGRTGTHAYYVTDLYPLTCRRIADARRLLTVPDLVGIVRGVVAGLRSLREKAGGRAHGRLKPANVLIGSDKDLAGASVVLTDPAPASALDPEASESDLRDVGALMFELVVHRAPPKGTIEVRFEDGWRAMGHGGEVLRSLCEWLLNSHAGPGEVTLEAISARLDEAMKARRKGSPGRKAAIIAAVVLVLGGAGAGAYLALRPKPLPVLVDPRGVGDASADWLKKDVDDLVQRVDRERTEWSIFQDAKDRIDEFQARADKLKDEIETIRARPFDRVRDENDVVRPATREEQQAIIDEAHRGEQQIAAFRGELDKVVGELRVAHPAEADPRGKDWTPKDYTLVSERLAKLAPTLRSEGGEGQADLEAIQKELDAVGSRIESIRAIPWSPGGGSPDSPAGADRDRILKEMRSAAEQAYKLNPRLTLALDASRKRLVRFVTDKREEIKNNAELTDPIRQAALAVIGSLDPSSDSTIGWDTVRGQLAELDRWRGEVASDVRVSLDFAPAQGSEIDPEPARRVLEGMVQQAGEELAGSVRDRKRVPAAGDAAYAQVRRGVAARLGDWIASARATLADAGTLEALLKDGYLYDEAGPGGQSIHALTTRIGESALAKEARACVEKPLAKADALGVVNASSDRAVLMGALTPGASASTAVTAWRRLVSAGFPKDIEELRRAPALAKDSVRPALGQVSPARRQSLGKEIDDGLRSMWLEFVNGRAGAGAESVEGAFALMKDFGFSEAELGQLNAAARFNYERIALVRRVSEVKDPDPKVQAQRLAEVVRDFWSTIDAGPASGAASEPGAQQLRKVLAPFLKGKATNLEEEGPGRASWKAAVFDDGARVTYSWNGHELEFIRVINDESNDVASYVCTIEAPVGLVIDLIDSAGKWEELINSRDYLPKPDLIDNRKGPRVWVWTGDGKMAVSAGIRPEPPTKPFDPTGNGWLREDVAAEMYKRSYYAPGIEAPAPPSAVSPMTYISPKAAVYVARLAGCRVPSSNEWAQALSQDPESDTNRRDGVWVQEHDYIRTSVQGPGPGTANGRAEWPNGGIFRTPTEGALQYPTDKDPAVPGSDGWLWFRPVDQGGGRVFHNLIGNVSEWVFEEPAKLDRISGATPEAVNAAMDDFKQVKVIGASALSPAGQDPATAQGLRSLGSAREGYSDVGFRLAFSTGAGGGAGKPAERLARLLRSTPYLTGSSR